MPDHIALVAREPEKLEATTQLVVVPHDRLRLQRLACIRQMELDRNPLSGLKLRRENRRHSAFADIE